MAQMRKRYASFLVLILSLAGAEGRADDPTTEFYVGQALERYYDLAADARSLSLGGSSNVTDSDASSVIKNPAGLGRLSGHALAASYDKSELSGQDVSGRETEQDTSRIDALTAFRLGGEREDGFARYGALSLGYRRYIGEADDVQDSDNDGHLRIIGYGIAVNPRVSLGYSLVFFDDQLRTNVSDLHSHSRFGHTFGLQYLISDSVEFGIAYLHGDGQADTESFSDNGNGLTDVEQDGVTAGASFKSGPVELSAAAGYNSYRSEGDLSTADQAVIFGHDEKGEAWTAAAGVEYFALPYLALRAGYRFHNITRYDFREPGLEDLGGSVDYNALSFGAGIQFDCFGLEELSLDYGGEYRATSEGDWEHGLTLNIKF